MGLPVAPGHPNYSAGGTSGFIPEIWSPKLNVKFYDATVATVMSNTDYEGEIKAQGDKVYIRTRGTVTIHEDYQKGQKTEPEYIESPLKELTINKSTWWHFGIDDVDKYQSDIELMDQWSEDATEQDKISIDTRFLAAIKAKVAAANKGPTAGRISAIYNLGAGGQPVELTEINAIKYILICEAVLEEQNIPQTGRYMIIPAIVAILVKDSIKDASMMGDGTSVLRNGRIGRIGNFTLYSSNLLPKTMEGASPCWDILFGHPLGITFASQYLETTYIDKPETTFGKFMKGLHVYDFEAIKAEAVGCLYAKPILF